MKAYVLRLDYDFDCESNGEVYLYDSFKKAHDAFVELASDWFDEELFNVDKPNFDKLGKTEWNDEKYNGFYNSYVNSDYLFIEETNNVVNYLNMSVEEHEIL